MTTFSQLVDDMILELVRPDLRGQMASWVNQTIREMHFKPGQNQPVAFHANRYERSDAVDSDNGWIWQLPSATRFQKLETLYSVVRGLYIPSKSPSISKDYSTEPWSDLYYYRSGPVISVAGVGSGDTLLSTFFMFPQNHAYKLPADRVVKYDVDTDSYVLIAGGGVPSETQMEIETDWILQRWTEVVKEGIRAKAWKRIGDGDRARMAFSAYENLRAGVWLSEPSAD